MLTPLLVSDEPLIERESNLNTNKGVMITFQTALCKVKYLDSEFGWEYDVLLFEWGRYKEPWKAVIEFDFRETSHNN